MAATLCHPQLPNFHCYEDHFFDICEPQSKGELQYAPCEEFVNVTHGVLRVGNRPGSPQTPSEQKQNIPVQVIDGFTGKKVQLVMNRTDNIGNLKEAFWEKMSQLQGTLNLPQNLAFNGKPVHPEMTMCELKVKPGATFVTFQRCHGG